MSDSAVVVFTYHPISKLLEKRGSQSWALSPDNAQHRTYIVCTRNRYFPRVLPHERAQARERHGAAFLIGRITTVEQSPDARFPDRHIVRFDKYAILDPQPTIWPGFQNPVWYVDDLKELGIDPKAQDWQLLPD